MDEKQTNRGITYQIRLKEGLHHPIAAWFDDITIKPQENGETLLIGRFVDQSALRGFLDQVWNLNFTVLSLERIEDEDHPVSDPRDPR